MQKINLNIQKETNSYSIIIDNFDLDELQSEIIRYVNSKKILVIISSKVNKLWGNKIFPIIGNFELLKFIMKDGENQKNIKTYQKIMTFAQKHGLTRHDCIIAIGGGVVGDMAGFVASTYMRGIKLIQIPTTLLACIDSSVGGKTGIDTPFGKNIIGTFYQPSTVIINTNFLKTLDDKQFKSGIGEALKYAFIEKSCQYNIWENLVNFLIENQEKILNRDEKILIKLIEICINLKKSVVEADEKELNLRRILNFGHTYGHALEKYGKYKKYTHGEAVAQGIKFALRKACETKLIDKNYMFASLNLVEKYGFKDIKLPPLDKLINIMSMDKKAQNGKIVFVLPTEYGEVAIHEFLPEEL